MLGVTELWLKETIRVTLEMTAKSKTKRIMRKMREVITLMQRQSKRRNWKRSKLRKKGHRRIKKQKMERPRRREKKVVRLF